MNIWRLLFGERKVAHRPRKLKWALDDAARTACDRLHTRNTCRRVDLVLVPGTIYRGGTRWGAKEPVSGKEAGGWCVRHPGHWYTLHVVCDPHTMFPLSARVNHEYGHALLYEIGMSESNHEAALSGAGL